MKLIPGGRWIRHLVWLLIVVASLRAHGQDIQPVLDEAIRIRLTFLAPNSLTLPAPEKDLGPPPPLIQSAGEDFVDAWKKWEFVTAPRPVAPKGAPPLDRKDLINAATDPLLFDDLVRRSLGGGPPPDPAEYDRFIYSTQSFCGNSGNGFMSLYEKSMTLTLLRLGKHSELLQRTARLATPARETLLQAFGIIPEEFQIGAWLHKAINPEELCKNGGERTARMLMDWVDFRWDVALERHQKAKATRNYPSSNDPIFPRAELVWLLRPDNGVTDSTQARIAAHIEGRGLQMVPLEQWLPARPQGAEKWLVPLARKGLDAPLNSTRKRASRLLTAAGVPHPAPALRPNPRFRVRINGQPWPGGLANERGEGPSLGMGIDFANGAGRAFRPDLQKPDILSYDADAFLDEGSNKSIHVYQFPTSWSGAKLDPRQPWLKGNVSLPLDFEKINEIDIRMVELTIRPKFPARPAVAPEDNTYEVEFGMVGVHEDRYIVTGQQPLVLSRVSPGDYTIRVSHAGALLGPKQEVSVTESNRLFESQLTAGSTLVVPIDWPELKVPDKLPLELMQFLSGSNNELHAGLRAVIRLKRKDGSIVEPSERMPGAANGRFPSSAVFPFLPPGEYEVESPDRNIEPEATYPGCVFRRSAVTVVIPETCPIFVTSEPLKVLYSKKD